MKAFKGNRAYDSYGISIPIIPDIKGIINLFVSTGTQEVILPFCIPHWGIVGEIKGY